MAISYTHSENLHTVSGAKAALPEILGELRPKSLIDVGCGTGTWMKAALDLGIEDLLGLNGVVPPAAELEVPESTIQEADLTEPLHLNRRFDILLCLEVAEHLDEAFAEHLISTLTQLSSNIVFSAAIPNQPGDHHINCQWPFYWQKLFNTHGFECEDSIRPKIWEVAEIEPWYRQNIFFARESDGAGSEPRIPSLIHKEMIPYLEKNLILQTRSEQTTLIENGRMPLSWYFTTPFRAVASKLLRIFSKT